MMKKLLLAMLLIVGATVVFADEAATRKAAEELMTVTRVKSQLENTFKMISEMTQKNIAQNLKGESKELSDKQKAALDRVMKIIEEEMSYDKLAPILINCYVKVYDEKELNDLIAFFKSPVGQAYLDKAPALQKELMQSLGEITAKMQKRVKDEITQMSSEEEAAKPAADDKDKTK